MTNYAQKKSEFLDSLEPDDFRNAGSFNQAEQIIDQLYKSLFNAVEKNENPQEFIIKAVTHLFRADSLAAGKAIELSKSYLEMMKGVALEIE